MCSISPPTIAEQFMEAEGGTWSSLLFLRAFLEGQCFPDIDLQINYFLFEDDSIIAFADNNTMFVADGVFLK